MSPKIRVLIGLITTAVFVGVGATLLVSERTLFGTVVITLGGLRAWVLFQQIRDL